MTPKSYKSNKKTTTQNIAISPALKDWVERYVRKMNQHHPEDDRYKSISAFYCTVMEKVLEVFEKDKNLEDFDRFIDSEVEDYTQKFFFKGLIPMYEIGVEMSRYTPFDMKKLMKYMIFLRNYYMKQFDEYDLTRLKMAFDRMKNLFKTNPVLKDLNVDLYHNERDKKKIKGVLEFSAYYKNLHFINSKFMAAILGFLGVKIKN